MVSPIEQNKENVAAGLVQCLLDDFTSENRLVQRSGAFAHAITAATGFAVGLAYAEQYPDEVRHFREVLRGPDDDGIIARMHEYLVRWAAGEMCRDG